MKTLWLSTLSILSLSAVAVADENVELGKCQDASILDSSMFSRCALERDVPDKASWHYAWAGWQWSAGRCYR